MTRFIILVALALAIGVFIKVGDARANAASAPKKVGRPPAKKRGWPGSQSRQKELDPEYYRSKASQPIQEKVPAAEESISGESPGQSPSLDGLTLLRKRDGHGWEYALCQFDAAQCARFQGCEPPAEPLALFGAEEGPNGLEILFSASHPRRYALDAGEFRFRRRGLSHTRFEEDGTLSMVFSGGAAYSLSYDPSCDMLSADSSSGMNYTVCSVRLMVRQTL